MPKNRAQDFELFKPSIYRFLTISSPLLCKVLTDCQKLVWSLYLLFLSPISQVGFNLFPRCQHMNQRTAKNSYIGILTTWERPIDPNNSSRFNTNSNLVPKTSTTKLVGKETPINRLVRFQVDCRLLNFKISAINRDFAAVWRITCKPTFPTNLKQKVSDELQLKKNNNLVRTTSNRSSAIFSSMYHSHFRTVFRSAPVNEDIKLSLTYDFKNIRAQRR